MGQALRLSRRDRRARCRRHRARGGLGGRGDDAGGQAAEAARHLGYQVVAQHPRRGRRIRPQPDAATSWSRGRASRDRNRALYMDGMRAQPGEGPGYGALAGGRTGQRGHRRPGPTRAPDRGDARPAHERPAGRPRPAGRHRGRPDGRRPADLGGGYPHVAPALRLARATWPSCAQLDTEARPDAALGRGHEHAGGRSCACSCPAGGAPSSGRAGRPGARTARSTTSSSAVRCVPAPARPAPRRFGSPSDAGRSWTVGPPAQECRRRRSGGGAGRQRGDRLVDAREEVVARRYAAPDRCAAASPQVVPARARPNATWWRSHIASTWPSARDPVKSTSDIPMVSSTRTRVVPGASAGRGRPPRGSGSRWRTRAGWRTGGRGRR